MKVNKKIEVVIGIVVAFIGLIALEYHDFKISKPQYILDTISDNYFEPKELEDIIKNRIGKSSYYIRFNSFNRNETSANIKSHVEDINSKDNLIIDIRDNSGGYIKVAEAIIDLFIEKDKEMFTLKEGDGDEVYYAKDSRAINIDNIYILTNVNTASVSELMILALREYYPNLVVVGTNTYGKYFSFGLKEYIDGTGVIFVNRIMIGPKGKVIPKEGIAPDVYIGNTEEYYESLGIDEQLYRDKDYELQMDKVIEIIGE